MNAFCTLLAVWTVAAGTAAARTVDGTPVRAAAEDTVRPDTLAASGPGAAVPEEPAVLTDLSERFDGAQLIAPAVFVTLGQFGTWESHAKKVNIAVRDDFAQWRGDCYFHADDYLQYLPAASYLGLGALGAQARHRFPERVIALGGSYLAMGILVNGVKYTVREMRPDGSSRNSFPSGHTATAFMGAELVRLEYGNGYGLAAYTVATGIGVLRMYNNRHWLSDVLAGAGIGILSAEIGYWLLPYGRRLFGVQGKQQQGPTFSVAPVYEPYTRSTGLALHLTL